MIMNDLHKQLAIRAGFDRDIFIDSENYDQGKQAAMFETLASMIVDQCVAIVQQAVLQREPASTYAAKIRDHFYRDPSVDFDRVVEQRCNEMVTSMIGKTKADLWWVSPNLHWNGKRPIEIPIREVYKYLMRRGGEW